MSITRALPIFFIPFLFACGSDNSDSSSTSLVLEELYGNWNIPCNIDPSDDVSSIEILTFSDNGYSVHSAQYSDSNCIDLDLEVRLNGSINYAGNKVISTGQTVNMITIQINSEQFSIRLKDETLIDIYNSRSTCGRTDWGNNTYKNVSDCDELGSLSDTFDESVKDIYFLDGNQLYFGSDQSELDENGFPSALKDGYATKKQ